MWTPWNHLLAIPAPQMPSVLFIMFPEHLAPKNKCALGLEEVDAVCKADG